jgi:GntR family transcriptional regulator, rspAB operon transcriptional repressor
MRRSTTSGAETAGQPPSVREIYAAIRQDIVHLQLRPGARLSENELAERFGISRTPVREALIRLVEDGLIEVFPQRGSFVRRISLQAVRQARFVRQALEIAIVREAAERGIAGQYLDNARADIAAQEAAGGDPAAFTEADDAFHHNFAEAIGLGEVWGVVEREKVQFDRIRFLTLPAITPISVLVSQHRAILAAIEVRDPAAAEVAMRQHLSEVLTVTDNLAANHPELIVDDVHD